ncbi:MAG: biosynthetic arginine decarboxylase, partial [Cyanobacteria bacterium J06648_11]
MTQAIAAEWDVERAAKHYGIDRWGGGFFGLSKDGKVTAKTPEAEVPLLDMVEGMLDRDLHMPVLLRIENILDAQISRLNEAFRDAIATLDYGAPYRGVYPLKVNQQAQVVEAIAEFGARYQHGFEVGSKAEMIAALSTLEPAGSLLICNGYKDAEFIELGLQAIELGFRCFFVIETPAELPIIIERSRALGVEPALGIRIKMSTKVSGHWNSTSGDRSVFGLTTTQIIQVIDTLKRENLLHCLELLHCHLGSQLPNIREIRSGVVEAARYYADLIAEGANLSHIDLGGGLAVDYSGSQSSDEGSRNYSLTEYCEDVVDSLKNALDERGIAHPTIVTESGRATVAYASVLLFNVLDVTNFEAASVPPAAESDHKVLGQMRAIHTYLVPNRLQECYNDALFYREEVRDLFKRGRIDLRTRAIAENL